MKKHKKSAYLRLRKYTDIPHKHHLQCFGDVSLEFRFIQLSSLPNYQLPPDDRICYREMAANNTSKQIKPLPMSSNSLIGKGNCAVRLPTKGNTPLIQTVIFYHTNFSLASTFLNFPKNPFFAINLSLIRQNYRNLSQFTKLYRCIIILSGFTIVVASFGVLTNG